jgi:hypothetical protein
MDQIKLADFEYEFARYVIRQVYERLNQEHPLLKGVNSDLFHSIAYFSIEKIQANPEYSKELKAKTNLTRGYYLNGPYVIAIDDVLIGMGVLKPEHHQFYGNDPGMTKLIDCDCH